MNIIDLLDEIKRGVLDESVEVFWSDYDESSYDRRLIKIGSIEILNGYVVLIPGDK